MATNGSYESGFFSTGDNNFPTTQTASLYATNIQHASTDKDQRRVDSFWTNL